MKSIIFLLVTILVTLNLYAASEVKSIAGINYNTIVKTAELAELSYCDPCTEPSFAYQDAEYNVVVFKHKSLLAKNKQMAKADKNLLDVLPKNSVEYQLVSSLKQKQSTEGYGATLDWLYDTQALFAYNKTEKLAFIAIRGTANFENWITNFDIKYTQFDDSKIKVLEGFNEYMMVMLESKSISSGEGNGNMTLQSEIKQAANDGARFIVTGHSLGGGVSVLLAAYLISHYNVPSSKIQLVTYAGPAAYKFGFNKVFENQLTQYVRFYNIGNPNKATSIIGDPVVNITAELLTHHFGMGITISEDSFSSKHDKQSSISYLISLHSMKNYLKYIKNNYTE